MAEGKGTFYAIGSRKNGILFVLTDPLRVSVVTEGDIQKHAETSGKTFDEAFGDFAAAAGKIITENDFADVPAQVPEIPEAIGKWIAGGMTMSDADFCFISELDLSGFVHARNQYPPVEAAMSALVGSGRSLRDAVDSDG